MRRHLLAIAALVVTLVGACTEEQSPVVEPPEGAVAATTSTTVAPTTTPTTLAQTPLPSGREAVDAFVAAWRNGDQGAAALVASPESVATIFAIPVGTVESRGCNESDVQVNVQCVFRLDTGELQVRAAPTPDGSGFLVDFVLLGS